MLGIDVLELIWVTYNGHTETASLNRLIQAEIDEQLWRYRVYYLDIPSMTAQLSGISNVSTVGSGPAASIISEDGEGVTVSTTGYLLDMDEWGDPNPHLAIHHPLDTRYFISAEDNGQPGSTMYLRKAIGWHYQNEATFGTVPLPNVITRGFATVILR